VVKAWIADMALALCALTGVALGSSSSGIAMQSGDAEHIRQPDHWIPMTIDYKIENADGGIYLREFRRSDGSVRHEMPLEPERGLTTITDTKGQRYFEFERGIWKQFPLRPLPFGGKPFMTLSRSKVTPVYPSDPRVQAAARLSSDLTYYEFVGPSGNKLVLCPELNMLVVWSEMVSGKIRATTKIVLGEPDVAFEPPTGAQVQLFSEPRGGAITERPSAKQGRRR
jgi:hypothetical protein